MKGEQRGRCRPAKPCSSLPYSPNSWFSLFRTRDPETLCRSESHEALLSTMQLLRCVVIVPLLAPELGRLAQDP